MKNLIIALSLFFALGASAQSKTNKKTTKATTTTATAAVPVDPRTVIINSAQKNVDQLIAFTPVSTETQAALKELFISKHSMLKDIEGFSPERKTILSEGIEYRLSLLLEPATFEKLKANKDLYSSLIN